LASARGRALLDQHSPGAAGRNRTLDHRSLVKEYIEAPTATEQARIAAHVDRRVASLDDLIDKKERLIELLRDKRRALITQAVTKGLDPSVPMKDPAWSG
jgi:type I restriction enzyme, S subunit